jgi:MoxR-like ATPase
MTESTPPAPQPEPNPSAPDPAAEPPAEIAPADADDVSVVKALNEAYQGMTEQLGHVIVGQHEVIEQVLVTIFCRGHALLVGVPGLAKTLLVSTLSQVLNLGFKRIQFTPDLMPSDITGTDVLEEDHTTGRRIFRFVRGPLFTNLVLADEINRTPPKTQAALLEAMQEHHVTVGEKTYPLPEPFFVLATQNPIEQEGTYPLPEAQLDRFMFNIIVDYPSAQEELDIVKQVTGTYEADLSVALTGDEVLRLQQVVRRVPVAEHVFEYARDLARATRPKTEEALDFIREMVAWGAGPRASIYLIMAAKARAILHGRYHATTEDVRAVAFPVLRHRVITTFNAEAAGITSDDVIERLLNDVQPAVEDAVA